MTGETTKARRISFSADSVLSAVVQDADTTELARILGAHGDEIRVNQSNHVGLTALHHGVLSNNLDAVKLLLCNGADVNAQDVHGLSPLHTAAAGGFTQVASLLVVYGADVFAQTASRELPIDLARELPVMRLLSEEMRRRLQAEVYLPALLRRAVRDCWFHARQLSGLWLGEVTRYLTQYLARLWSGLGASGAGSETKLMLETSPEYTAGGSVKKTSPEYSIGGSVKKTSPEYSISGSVKKTSPEFSIGGSVKKTSPEYSVAGNLDKTSIEYDEGGKRTNSVISKQALVDGEDKQS